MSPFLNACLAGTARPPLLVRLVVAVLVLNLCFGVLAGVSLLQSHREQEDRARVTAQNLVQLLEHDIAGYVNKLDLALFAVTEEIGREERGGGISAGELNTFMARLKARVPEVDSLRMADAQGEISYGTGLQLRKGTIADREYFQILRRDPHAGLVFSKPVVGKISGKWVIIIARRLDRPDGTFAGVVYGAIPLDHFLKQFSTIAVGRHGSISLRDGELNIIARYTVQKGSVRTVGTHLLSPEFTNAVESDRVRGTFYTPASWEGIAKTVSYRRVANYPLYAVVGLAKEDYLNQWWKNAAVISALLGLFSLSTLLMSRMLYKKWRQEQQAQEALGAAKEALEVRVMERTADLHKTSEKLRLSEQRFRAVLENTSLIAVIMDPEAHVTFCNDFLLDLTGWQREEVVDGDWFELFIPAEARARCRSRYAQELAGAALPIRLENRIVTRSGQYRTVSWNNTVLHDAEGRIAGIAGLGVDITEQRSLEEQLLQAQKMEAVGQLAGGIAHDFNNLLMVIIGYSSMLRMSAHNTKELSQIEAISAAAERAAKLTSSLLAFSRKESMDAQPQDLNRIVANVHDLMRRVIGEDVRLTTRLSSTTLTGNVDNGKIDQLLVNLATNARDAMPRGGALTISTEPIELDEEFALSHGYGIPGSYALITVSDTGIGMDEATRKRVFEPFFTTKEVGKGTGLGMAIVYGIVKQHRGFINVYSEPGRGTAFRIYLPLLGRAACPEERKEPGAPAPVTGTETILVVEDDPLVQGVVHGILSASGYRVIVAGDGEEGVEKFAQNRQEVKLVLMDIIMPKVNGKEASRRIKELQPGAKILYTSGYTADIIESRGELDPQSEIVMKPVQPRELLRKVRELLDQ